MKNFLMLLVTLLVLTTQQLFAQEAITDDDIKKYAVTMDSIEHMKSTLLEDISEMVKSNEDMTNERYNELSKIVDNKTKLEAAKATPEEIAFIKQVVAKKKEGTAEISKTFQILAKEYIGAAAYNKVKKALKTDASIKSKYDSFIAELEADDETAN